MTHKEMIGKGYLFDPNTFEPLKCPNCGCTEYIEEVTGTINGYLVCEFDAKCKDCGELLNQWAYGSWSPY